MAISNVYNRDCLEAMKEFPDNFFNLTIVDPPYGMPQTSSHGRGKLKNRVLNTGNIQRWDVAPDQKYFDELFRVSKNQIIWGGNYFGLPKTRCFIVWDKEQPWENFSAAEYAWTSFDKPAKIFREAATRTGEKKIHPTQKSVKLYDFCLFHFAKEGDKILDTHLGSGSSRIACHDMGFDFWGYELDKDYFEAMEKRFQNHIKQPSLFAPQEMYHQTEIKQ